MRGSTAQQKRHAPWLWTKRAETEKDDVRVRTRGGLTASVWKDWWQVYMLTCTHHQLKENFLWSQQPPRDTSPRVTVQPERGLRRQFWSYGQQLFDESTYLQVDHEIVFPPSGSNSSLNRWILLSSCGAKYTHRDFRLLLVRNLIEEERGKIAPPADWLEDQVGPQHMLCDSTAALTNNDKRNHPRNSTAVRACVFSQCIVHQMWRCALLAGISH